MDAGKIGIDLKALDYEAPTRAKRWRTITELKRRIKEQEREAAYRTLNHSLRPLNKSRPAVESIPGLKPPGKHLNHAEKSR